MKKFFKNFLVIIGIITAVFSINTTLLQTHTYAEVQVQDETKSEPKTPSDEKKDSTTNASGLGGCRYFLGMPSWDCHISDDWSGDNLSSNIWKIAGNVSEAIIKLATYLVVGYVIYGGYLYIFSSGDPAKAAAGKKTLSHALIGLAIVGLANIIISSANIAILGSNGGFDGKNCTQTECVSPESLVQNMLNWVIGIAGVVSAVYIVIGGIGYMTSAGDAAKLQKAKTTILYSLIGLAIVGLSLVITNNGVSIILAANQGDDIRTPILSLLNSVVTFLGIIAVIFIIKGAVSYMTSSGDPGKVKSARDTIIYACIGLAICAIAFAIVNWATGEINKVSKSTPGIITLENVSPSLSKNTIAFLEKKL